MTILSDFVIGFNTKTISFKGMSITAWDLGGRTNLRAFWRLYYSKTVGIVYVIDAADRHRIEESAEELKRLLSEEELLGVPLLIFANKSDLQWALTPEEILKSLSLDSARKSHICQSVATRGQGLEEGVQWLSTAVR
jgi:small GTP-binding protein